MRCCSVGRSWLVGVCVLALFAFAPSALAETLALKCERPGRPGEDTKYWLVDLGANTVTVAYDPLGDLRPEPATIDAASIDWTQRTNEGETRYHIDRGPSVLHADLTKTDGSEQSLGSWMCEKAQGF